MKTSNESTQAATRKKMGLPLGSVKSRLGKPVLNEKKKGILSVSSKDEIEQLVEILKAVKGGDFSVRLSYEKGGVLSLSLIHI